MYKKLLFHLLIALALTAPLAFALLTLYGSGFLDAGLQQLMMAFTLVLLAAVWLGFVLGLRDILRGGAEPPEDPAERLMRQARLDEAEEGDDLYGPVEAEIFETDAPAPSPERLVFHALSVAEQQPGNGKRPR